MVTQFKCLATHLGEWLGRVPTGVRFDGVDEVYTVRGREGRIIHA